jgi:hypothetical protein
MTTMNLQYVHQGNVESIVWMQKGRTADAARLQVRVLWYLQSLLPSYTNKNDDASHCVVPLTTPTTTTYQPVCDMVRPFMSMHAGPLDRNESSTTIVPHSNHEDYPLLDFFNRGFCLIPHDDTMDHHHNHSAVEWNESTATTQREHLLVILTLFNTALAFHRLGMEQHHLTRHCATALHLYDKVLGAMAPWDNDPVSTSMCVTLQLAVHWNKRHIYSCYTCNVALAHHEQDLFVSVWNQCNLDYVSPQERILFAMEHNRLQYTYIVASAAA